MPQTKPHHRPHDFTGGLARREAGDFTTDRRVLALIGMALIVGSGGALAAKLLVSLIALVTNLAWFGSSALRRPLQHRPRARSGWS